MAVSKRLRYEVLRRDSNTCRYCGGKAPDVVLTVDHVVPTALGGSDDPSNLVAACKSCKSCNAGKAASSPDAPLVADVDQRAAEWGRAMTVAMDRRMAEFSAENARVEAFDRTWKAWSDMPREAGWRDSIRRFLAFGLTDAFLVAAVDTAMGNRSVRHGDVWKYFCGICWKEIKNAQASLAPNPAAAAGSWPAASLVVPDDEDEVDEFPIMHMFGHYVDHLLDAVGVADQLRRKIAFRSLWDSMAETDQVWRGVHPHFDDVVPTVDSEGRPVSRLDATEEFLFTTLAFDMHQIKELGDQGAAPNGQE